MLVISFYYVNCVIISCKLSFSSRFTHVYIQIMLLLGFQKAELGCKFAKLGCNEAGLDCHDTKVKMLSFFDARGRTELSEINNFPKQVAPLSSTGSILSNTDLSDLSTVGTCDIFVYQTRHRVMWFARLADSILFIKRIITCHWNGYMKMPCGECFQKCFSAYNIISLWLNTVISIIVMIWLPKMTRYLHWRIIYRHLTLVTF